MSGIPLIPKGRECQQLDVSHVLKEALQDVLDSPEFYRNVAKNVCKYNAQNTYLQRAGKEITEVYHSTKLDIVDLSGTECNVMTGQGEFLKQENLISKDAILAENVKLKSDSLFPELPPTRVQKYNLLQKRDILPCKPIISMDFRLNSNRHRCTLSCGCSRTDIAAEKQKIGFIQHEKSAQTRTKAPFLKTENVMHKAVISQEMKISHRPSFKLEPDEIFFSEYKTATLYEKKFKLINSSQVIQSFAPLPTSCDFPFKVEICQGGVRLAPGMAAVFSVKYYTDVYKNVKDLYKIITRSGEELTVKLESFRTPPCLMVFVFRNFESVQQMRLVQLGLSLSFSETRRLALNSSIDCGDSLVGYEANIDLLVKNEGKYGRFFILDEDDWYFNAIPETSSRTKKTIGAFSIYPVYFEIDEGDFIELEIQFLPEEYGVAVEKLFILCDNNAVQEIELIGDGLVFETSTVTVDSELHLKTQEFCDPQTNYVVDFKECLPFFKYYQKIKIHNTCGINFYYKWLVRESQCDKTIDFNSMDPSWVTVTNAPQLLRGRSSTDFQLVLQSDTVIRGLTSLVLVLHILDVPETCLSENASFCVLENLNDDNDGIKMLDVVVAEIEIIANFEEILVTFNPPEIRYEQNIEIHTSLQQKFEVCSHASTDMACEWQVSNHKVIRVHPTSFVLKSKGVFTCKLRIVVCQYEDINETLTFKVEKDLYVKTLDVVVKVVKPRAVFSTIMLNFGSVPKGKNVPPKFFSVINKGEDKVEWFILECFYDFNKGSVFYKNSLEHLSSNRGVLAKGQSKKISYTISHPTENCKWFSFLILASAHPSLVTMESIILVLYEVAEPQLTLHCNLPSFPTIFPGKLLYLGCTSSYCLCVHNTDRKLAGSFTFGTPRGYQANCIEVIFKPKSGIIPPEKCTHVLMSLTPLKPGIIEDVQIRCFLNHNRKPAILTVMCVVDNIRLNIYLPKQNDAMEKIVWPSTLQDLQICNSSIAGEVTLSEEGSPNLSAENLQLDLEVESNGTVELLEEMHFNSSESDFLWDTFVDEEMDTDSLTPPTDILLQTCFGSNLTLHEHVTEVKLVPVKKLAKTTIIIENVTPIPSAVSVCAKRFLSKPTERTREKLFNQLLVDLKLKQGGNEWEELVNDYGIAVRPSPQCATIEIKTPVEIDLWIYANTWGIYVEEIAIMVESIGVFTFNMLIEVVGSPIEFPMSLNSILDETVMRFGTFTYLSEPKSRMLKIKNISTIPVCLVWHIFFKTDYFTSFNLLMDTFESDLKSCDDDVEELSTKLLITKKYYGKEDHKIFQVTPRCIRLKPKQSKMITITHDPRHFPVKFEKTDIEADLLGYVHLKKDHK
ncbi:uncharacterized protein LOC116177310 isoform X2 [Photinus pyralis]|nr:uncharacterized protein LOC116177310 isoform X2 [Photinus pyralis]